MKLVYLLNLFSVFVAFMILVKSQDLTECYRNCSSTNNPPICAQIDNREEIFENQCLAEVESCRRKAEGKKLQESAALIYDQEFLNCSISSL